MTEGRDRLSNQPRPSRLSWQSTAESRTRLSQVADESTRPPAMAEASNGANHTPLKMDTPPRREGREKGHRYRASGGFLLQDAAAGSASADDTQTHRRRRSRRLLQSIRPRSSSTKQGKSQAATSHDGDVGASPLGSAPLSPSSAGGELSVGKTRTSADEGPASPGGEGNSEHSALDVESAQIVDMALRISESRRLASQRVVSQQQQLPPRLSPLPDTAGVSSLRQHLLQQRKLSRNASPRADRPRNASSLRHAFESFDVTAQDGSYHYHISRSTLARVQKIKEYIELMAQYRRLLEHLPPLRAAGGNPLPAGASGSPSSGIRAGNGRQYNPLQYIRNRKVRARERQAIDGEAQGFGGVVQVTNWVDDVVDLSNADGLAPDWAHSLPTFAGAEPHRTDVASTSASSKTSAKLAKRRVDWLIEPADLIADAYWLEQGSNKSLIEDRDWNRLYPRVSDASLRPHPQLEERHGYQSPPATGDYIEEPDHSKPVDANEDRADADQSHTSPRERRLHVRGLHHRQHSSAHNNHDSFVRMQRGSTSDLSDSDGEFKGKTVTTGTITKSGKDILAKQMLEMIAREEIEGTHRKSRADASQPHIASEQADSPSNMPSRIHSRTQSYADINEPDGKRPWEQGPNADTRLVRPRVDVPVRGRRSVESDTALSSPDHLRPRDAQGGLSPLHSRGTSPLRKPFSKVKQYLGERKDGAGYLDDKIRAMDVDTDLHRWSTDPFTDQPEHNTTSPDRRDSGRSSGKTSRKTSMDGRRHTRGASMKMKAEEATGLRGLFKAPARIDNVLRTGVSKIGDIIWRKEFEAADAGELSEGVGSDLSEDENKTPARRGSRGQEDALARARKSYFDQMPVFHALGRHATGVPPGNNEAPSEAAKSSRRPSIQSGLDDGRSPRDRQVAAVTPAPVPESTSEDGRSRRPAMAPAFNTHHYSTLSLRTMGSGDPEKDHLPLSKREIARLRALLLSSGIMAMEIFRRANTPRPFSRQAPFLPEHGGPKHTLTPWPEVYRLGPGDCDARLADRIVAPSEAYPLAAQVLTDSITAASHAWQEAAGRFATETSPALQSALDARRVRLAVDLSSAIGSASDAADEAAREVTQTQRLRVKRVVDVIEKMMRRRRRRFRWVRRAGWLAVEWVVVGAMWWVWFMVMMMRVAIGVGRGGVRVVRWLLWL